MKRRDNVRGVGIPYFSEAEWHKAKAVMADGHTFHDTYAEFTQRVAQVQAELARQHQPTVRVCTMPTAARHSPPCRRRTRMLAETPQNRSGRSCETAGSVPCAADASVASPGPAPTLAGMAGDRSCGIVGLLLLHRCIGAIVGANQFGVQPRKPQRIVGTARHFPRLPARNARLRDACAARYLGLRQLCRRPQRQDQCRCCTHGPHSIRQRIISQVYLDLSGGA